MGTSTVIQAVAAFIALGLYFLPAILADRRKRHDLLTLALFNACLGWTGFGWFAACKFMHVRSGVGRASAA